ncbi:Chromosome partition protein smc [hydrothermal vent metagenome]|uniref:Chromosome partition protein smc n=1 Tax=hydrothermal vent metagenome TaxID=652676 RepID=A0A3B1CKS8_9ZZZZ
MYFKNFEIRGFKSFVDYTRIELEPGITAIVGPNGCGKSNIVDAIRWALGEQSAKLMRGTKMEDFIFNGSQSRKPTGAAEVSVTFSNTDGSITTQPYAEYEDITVTRKVFRTGESEYYINKVPCRLKDIVDVFLDTGVATRSLSIIEQDQIAKIINSKPEDRRFVIEEAAGVMKYKHRRHAAQNKLAASQQNLLRVQDILAELERQRNSLSRQAKKAERFAGYRGELKSRALISYCVEYQRHTNELESSVKELEQAKESEAAYLASLSTKRNEVEVINIEISRNEKKLAELKEERNQISSGIDRNEHHRDLLSRQLNDLTEGNEREKNEINELEQEMLRIDELLEERTQENNRLKEELAASESELGRVRAEAQQLRDALDGRVMEQKRISGESLKLMENISSIQNTQSSIKTRLEMAVARIERISGQERKIDESLHVLEESLSNYKKEHAKLRDEIEAENKAGEQIADNLEKISASLEHEKGSLRQVEEEHTRKYSRLESIEELEKNMEGFGAGVRNLIKMKEEGNEAMNGIRGLLVDGIRAPKELESALAAILGARLETVIVENSSTSISAINILKQGNIGRSGFLSNDLKSDNTTERDPAKHEALLGLASRMITFDDSLPGSVAGLFKNTLVAKDLESALEIWRENSGGFTVVTLEGDIIDPSGLVTGGGADSDQGAKIVARKRMIEELLAEIGELEIKKNALSTSVNALEASQTAEKERQNASNEKLRSFELKYLEITKEIQKEEAEIKRDRGQLDVSREERAKAVSEKGRLAEEESALSEKVGELESRKEEIDTANRIESEEIDSLRAKLEDQNAGVREGEVKLTEIRGKLDNIGLDVQRLEGNKTDIVIRLRRLKDSIKDFSRKRDEMKESMESMLEENIEQARRKEALSADVNGVSEKLGESQDVRTQMNQDLKELENNMETARSIVADISLAKSELEIRVENIIEKADHDFNIPLEDLETTDVADINEDEVNERLAFLRSEIARIGDVNMSALEEFQEIKERFEFIKNQSADLTQSIATLKRTIENISAKTNSMFMETYDIVSKNFEQVFKRVFGGGRAEMRLVQEEGKPEPGLEIFVQPPGKRIQSLNLLSAGEKAMTSIALLFAVFMTKPSPFCLLDEVDAPLDEANIVRFRDMLNEMKKDTQFIIITHNQKTMSFADKLYGVTQEEEGISKILAVNLVDHRTKDFAGAAA